jgi:hypothetical protein
VATNSSGIEGPERIVNLVFGPSVDDLIGSDSQPGGVRDWVRLLVSRDTGNHYQRQERGDGMRRYTDIYSGDGRHSRDAQRKS